MSTIDLKNISVTVWKEGNWYIAKCLEIEVASQGKTEKKALENLKEALELYLETAPHRKNSTLESIKINLINA